MILLNVQTNTVPDSARLEQLPEIGTRVILAKNIREETLDLDDQTQTVYVYDEADFVLPEDRTETIESITENFDEWWEYATEEHGEPSLEDRVSTLESIIDFILEG
jgi:ribosome biogenesis GTPase A